MIKLYSLGAAGEVTGSKHILQVNNHAVMIDCGAFQGKRQISDDKNRNFASSSTDGFDPATLDAVVLTHGHYDHCGLLPVLAKRGYHGNIYATPATRDIANLVMMDSARIQARDAEFLAKQANKKGEKFSWKPLFSEDDVVKTANQIISVSYNREIYIAPNIALEFFDAGHILGSAFALLTVTDGERVMRILFTGDIGRKEKPIIRNPATSFPAPDYIVLESTYGDRKHEDRDIAIKKLERLIKESCQKRGKIIIPSFAIERAQELVFYLHILTDKRRIPVVPIYVDSPMAANATSVFRVHPECYDESVNEAFLRHHKNPFGFNSLMFTTSVEESKALNKKDGPMIIISADGMCEAGRVQYHLAADIGDERNTVLIVGYMAENTLGRKIRDGAKEVHILGETYQVRARVETLNAFSAHADYTEMTKWLQDSDTSNLKSIFLVHGEPDAQSAFVAHLHENGFPRVQCTRYGEVYTL